MYWKRNGVLETVHRFLLTKTDVNMLCPNCGKQIELSHIVEGNVEIYGGPAVGRSECCGIGIRVTRIVHLKFEPYTGDKKQDDWGVPIKQFIRK